MMETRYIQTELKVEDNICSPDYDGIILVSGTPPGSDEPEPFKSVLFCAAQIDCALFDQGAVLPINLPAKRVIYSPTGKINPDYDDVRVFSHAASKGIKRALKAGVKCPLLVLLPDTRFENTELVTLLGALEALYVPLEVREIGPERCRKATRLGVWSTICNMKLRGIVKLAGALESGRFIARDIGGSDPERMAPPRIQDYICQAFEGTSISVQVVSDCETLKKEYPCLAAVNRAASVIPRHAGRVIFLTYEPCDPTCVLETVMIVGKGVTYDTGGADVKSDMTGMSRDKCGAAAAVGFMQVVNLLQPPTVKVIVAIGVVRNSIGENSYVADEIVTARSGVRVRVNNTDAEGRMVMADILYHVKEMALCSVNPHIYTIATLTGHACLTAGTGYSIAIDNSVARSVSSAFKLQSCGEAMGDMFEVSILRPEDFEGHKGQAEGDDVLQSGKSSGKSSAKTERGHQKPCAFLVLTSGLDKHGKTAEKPLKYSHLDIAASAGDLPDPATGAPILALSNRFLTKEFEQLLTEKKQ